VGEHDAFNPSGTSFSANVGQAFNGTVATFTDTDTVTPASDLAASIDWGDGTTTAGVVSGSAGSFSVSGSHTYGAAATNTLHVTLSDDAPGTATATATSTATVTSQNGQTFILTTSTDHFTGGVNSDTFIAAAGTPTKNDTLDGAGGTDEIVLTGPGTFDLRKPKTIINIETIEAKEGQAASGASPAQNQIIYLRDGMNATVNVGPATIDPSNPKAPTISIIGAHNAAIINLSSGNDVVTMGDVLETLHGGTGNDTAIVNKSTIGATIDGGGGVNTLQVKSGGIMAMGNNITNMQKVVLTPEVTAYDFTANAINGLLITDSNTLAFDTIRAGGLNQTLTGGGAGKETMFGFSGGNTTFKNNAATFNNDTIHNFDAPNAAIDITNMNSGNLQPISFVEDGSNTFGTLTVSDGTRTTALTLFGQFMAQNFHAASDGGSGTVITYQQPQQLAFLAASH
jgi:hypothetical protein